MGWPWMVSCSAVLFLKEDRGSGEQVADGLPLLLPSVPHPLFPNVFFQYWINCRERQWVPGPYGDLFGDLGPLFMFWVPLFSILD